jgi:hypothetical protein
MRQVYLDDTSLTTEEPESRREYRHLVRWPLILGAAAVVCSVLWLDASMTPQERIAVFEQSHVFP